MNQTTILSYNILEGLQQSEVQIDVFVKWVTDLDPDIIFYQELNGFSEKSFAELAARCGHPYSVKIEAEGYKPGLSSKHQITNIRRVTEELRLGYIYAQIQDYHVFALHLDPFKEEERVKEIDKLLAHANTLPEDASVMLVGDFNALARSDLATYSDPAFISNMKASNTHFTLDFLVIDAMLEAGYFDAYKLFHSDFKRSFPTAKRIIPGDQGRRIDYAFLSPALKERCASAEIIHDKITRFLSDHYPLLLRINP